MSTKTKKILVFILTAVIMLSFLGTTVFAADGLSGVWDKVTPDYDTDNTTAITGIGNKVLGVLQIAGVVIGVIILVILGLKYMMGSLEEKAEYKKTMIPYLVGAIVILAGPALARAIFSLIQGLGNVAG